MGLVDDDLFESELNNSNNEIPSAQIKNINHGRKSGDNNVPESLRKLIGEEALVSGSKELARQFNVSDSSISAYKNGATSTASYNTPDESLAEHIDDVKDKIEDIARNKLLSALDQITEDKLKGTKARDLAGIAKDMSAVVKNLEVDKESGVKGPTFVIFAPSRKQEEFYETINLNEK